MNVASSRVLVGLIGLLVTAAPAFAGPVPVKVNLTNLRCIQNYEVSVKDDDKVYLTVTGVAKGADVAKRVPETGTTPANSKKAAVTEDAPVTLWEGELGDGEFALLTVTLFQGNGDDAAKTFGGQVDAAAKGAPERAKKTLASADELKALAAATVKAQQGVVAKVKDTLNREKNTDHFGGLFNVTVWNNNGTIVKRLDPVGLTFGEHFGNDEKVYTKIKYTRNNVSVRDPDGQYFPQVMPPISEDKTTVRAKMLETEYLEVEKDGKKRRTKNVTDYLADIEVLANGEPVKWKLEGENIGPSQIHMYWDWAE